jgi:uncharacterized protein
MNPKKIICCPLCGKKDTWKADNPKRPFCSERCKMIDLGEWASEGRRIAGNAEEEENILDTVDSPFKE